MIYYNIMNITSNKINMKSAGNQRYYNSFKYLVGTSETICVTTDINIYITFN